MMEHGRQERTDRLETTLQTLQALQQTGILNMERARGGVRETATIVFLQGQPVQATAGELVDEEALEWITTWGSCRYIFEVRFPSEIVVPPSPPPAEVPAPSSPLSFISQVVHKYTQSASEVFQEHNDTLAEYSVPTTPRSAVSHGSAALPTTAPQSPERAQAHGTASPHAPYRLLQGPQALSYIERSGLSRLHRHVFFLLDGQRSAIDIVRLTGRSFHEIQQLLADLEQLKLIRQEHVAIGGG